jgi:hypothetical protein
MYRYSKKTRMKRLLPLVIAMLFAPVVMWAGPCTPKFPLEKGKALGWQGADAAYSIPLPDGRDIWIFGDTLYGKERVVNGQIPRMTHNSLGISTCDAQGRFHLQYVIRHDAAGKALSYFSPKSSETWYWAMDGFVANHELWVTLLCIRHVEKHASAAMDFESCGADLAEVSHLDRDPQRWTVKYHPLVPDGVKAYPTATAVVDGDSVYLFALYESGGRPMLLTRIPLRGLNQPAAHLEYLRKDGTWQKGLHPETARHVEEDGATEMSVRYHPGLHKWLQVLMDPQGFTGKIFLRTAPAIDGPWTKGEVIYNMPEMQKNHPGWDKDTFCYAAKEHPEFEQPGDLVLTYVCNTMDVPKLVTNLDIYYPQVVRETLPPM